ncbi:peroxiredoxin [Halostella pelagica]|uniref:peroxiredoxin n=1 Tax=Halostella pelagica TaxID=2583824 RepID=UPI001080B6EE|nr:peroxiredoxin [Halostella pelagica]
MTLAPGDDAPKIAARNQDDGTVRIDGDAPTVLYFYPKDATPGCTTEARQFQAELESYRDAGITVYGVSTDTVDDHRAFCEAEGLDFDLLADPDGDVADAFDVDRTGGVTDRTTFVLADGEVYAVYEDVAPDGHAREVLRDLLDDGLAAL